MKRIITATSAIAALTMTGAAACSDGGGSPSTGTGTSPRASGSPGAAIYRQAAACIRPHGVPNFPDFVQDSHGQWNLPASTQKPPQSAIAACQAYLSKLPETSGRRSSPPLSAADMAKARQWAQCMRQHGLADWPDPKPDGTFELPDRLMQGGKAGFRSQLQACRKYSIRGIQLTSSNHG